jgi:deoxyribodipyrimidine photo-lyase
VPELADVPTKYVHTPWMMPPELQGQINCIIGRDYPQPIVDHGFARQRALAAYKQTN